MVSKSGTEGQIRERGPFYRCILGRGGARWPKLTIKLTRYASGRSGIRTLVRPSFDVTMRCLTLRRDFLKSFWLFDSGTGLEALFLKRMPQPPKFYWVVPIVFLGFGLAIELGKWTWTPFRQDSWVQAFRKYPLFGENRGRSAAAADAPRLGLDACSGRTTVGNEEKKARITVRTHRRIIMEPQHVPLKH